MEQPYNEENASLFGTYISLYANDIACNYIKDIKPYTLDKDKETKKIWGALERRVNEYFARVRKCVKMQGLYFLSDFNGVLDECISTPVDKLDTCISNVLKKHNVNDDGIIATSILAHILTEYSINTVQTLSNTLKRTNNKLNNLDGWVINEINRVLRNFYFWVCRKLDNAVIDDIKQAIEKDITELQTQMVDNFERAYQYAMKIKNESNERTTND